MGRLLLAWLTGGRHQALQPHVGHDVAVVLVGVADIQDQDGERSALAPPLDSLPLGRLRIRHRIRQVAVFERRLLIMPEGVKAGLEAASRSIPANELTVVAPIRLGRQIGPSGFPSR